MNIRCTSLAIVLSLLSLPSVAQTKAVVPGASAPAGPASGAAGRDPRILSPDEKRENATVGTPLRPERPVQPQVKVPLGVDTAVPAAGAASGSVDDAAARCLALKSKTARTECQARLQVSAPAPMPAR